jgi:hypothetical protein
MLYHLIKVAACNRSTHDMKVGRIAITTNDINDAFIEAEERNTGAKELWDCGVCKVEVRDV